MKKGKDQFVSQYQPKATEFKFCAQLKALQTLIAQDTASKLTFAIKKEEIDKLPKILKLNLNVFVSDQLVKDDQKAKSDSSTNPGTDRKAFLINPESLKHLHYSELESTDSTEKFVKKINNFHGLYPGQGFVVADRKVASPNESTDFHFR